MDEIGELSKKRILKNNPSKVIYPSNWRIIKNKGQYFYKDKKNIITIKSKYIHSKGLLDNLGLAIKIALDFKVKPSIIQKTIPKINYEGRIQYIQKGKLRNHLQKNEQLLLDGAHSKTSAKNLYDYLKETKLPLYCVWAMQKNKFPKEFLKEFGKNEWSAFEYDNKKDKNISKVKDLLVKENSSE